MGWVGERVFRFSSVQASTGCTGAELQARAADGTIAAVHLDIADPMICVRTPCAQQVMQYETFFKDPFGSVEYLAAVENAGLRADAMPDNVVFFLHGCAWHFDVGSILTSASGQYLRDAAERSFKEQRRRSFWD